MKSKLPILLLGCAVSGSAVIAFGVYWGLLVAAVTIIAIAWIASSSRPWLVAKCVFVVLATALFIALLLPAISRGPTPVSICQNRMSLIALAIDAYRNEHERFPPAWVDGSDGKPWHSWRVLILPYLDEQELYDSYRFNEPWDGPNNRRLIAKAPSVFRCASAVSGAESNTSYLAVVGPETIWSPEGRTRAKRPDGHDTTLLFAEVADAGVAWSEPRDLSVDEALARDAAHERLRVSSPHRIKDTPFENGYPIANLCTADGSVHWMAQPIPAAMLRAMLTVDGGDRGVVDLNLSPPRSLNWSSIAGLIMLLISAPWLLFRVIRAVERRQPANPYMLSEPCRSDMTSG